MSVPINGNMVDLRDALDRALDLEGSHRAEQLRYRAVKDSKGKQYYTNRALKKTEVSEADNPDKSDKPDEPGEPDKAEAPDSSGDIDPAACESEDNADGSGAKRRSRKRRDNKTTFRPSTKLGGYLLHESVDHAPYQCLVAFVTSTTGNDVIDGQLVGNLDLTSRLSDSPASRRVPAVTLTPPAAVMNSRELALFNKVKSASEPAPWPPTASELQDIAAQDFAQELQPITEKKAITLFWFLRKSWPKTYATFPVTEAMLTQIKVEYNKQGYSVTRQDLRRWFKTEVIVTSAGELPVTQNEIRKAQDAAEERAAAYMIGSPDEHQKALDKAEEEDNKQKEQDEKAKRSKRYLKHLTPFELLDLRGDQELDEQGRLKVEQNKDSHAHINLTLLGHWFSKIHITVNYNYKDANKSHLQPKETIYIHMNQDNLREPGATGGDYVPSHSYFVVKHVEDILGLFGHVPKKEMHEMIRNTGSGEDLILVRMHYGGRPVTSNLFVPDRYSKPGAYLDTRLAFRNEPVIYVLVRAPEEIFRGRLERIFNHFKTLAVYDPTLHIFKDSSSTYPNAKNAKPIEQWERFNVAKTMTAPSKNFFARNMLCIPSLAEHLFEIQKQGRYEGQAVILPVPGSQHRALNPEAKNPPSLSYFADVRLERNNDMPRLMPGDRFDFQMGITQKSEQPGVAQIAWYGQVVTSATLGIMDSIKIFIFRKLLDDNGRYVTNDEISDTPVSKVNHATASTFKKFFQATERVPVTLFGQCDVLSAKREQKALSLLMSTKKQLGQDEQLYHLYQNVLLFGQGVEYQIGEMAPVPVFAHLPNTNLEVAIANVMEFCSPDQLDKFMRPAIEIGSPAAWYLLDGPGGTGKSELCLQVESQYYAFGIQVPAKIYNRTQYISQHYRENGQIDEAFQPPTPASAEQPEQDDIATPPVQASLKTLCVSLDNETVDAVTERISQVFAAAGEAHNKTPMVIRLHSPQTTEKSVLSELLGQIEGDFRIPSRHFRDGAADLDNEITKLLYALEHPTSNDNIKDKRWKSNMRVYTLGWYIAQIYGKIPHSPQLLAKFTKQEIRGWANIPDVQTVLGKYEQGQRVTLDREHVKKVNGALSNLVKQLFRVADVITGTFPAVLSPILRGCFFPHAIHIEEIGRAPESLIFAVKGQFPFSLMVFGNCDHQQIGCMSFGDKKLPWTTQRKTSLPQRLLHNGFPLYCLGETHRFKNQDALQVAQIANPGRDITAAPSSFDEPKSKLFRRYIHQRFSIDSTVGFVHMDDIDVRTDSTRSSYAPKVIIAMVNEARDMAIALELEDDLAVVTPYNASVLVFRNAWETVLANATPEECVYLKRVYCVTTDTMMGQQAAIVFGDQSVMGHLWDPDRSNVALTRHRYVYLAFGSHYENTRALPGNKVSPHAILTQFAWQMQNAKRVYVLPDAKFRSYNKFTTVFKLLGVEHGLEEPTKEDLYAENIRLPFRRFEAPQEEELNDDDLDIEDEITQRKNLLATAKFKQDLDAQSDQSMEEETALSPDDDILHGLDVSDNGQPEDVGIGFGDENIVTNTWETTSVNAGQSWDTTGKANQAWEATPVNAGQSWDTTGKANQAWEATSVNAGQNCDDPKAKKLKLEKLNWNGDLDEEEDDDIFYDSREGNVSDIDEKVDRAHSPTWSEALPPEYRPVPKSPRQDLSKPELWSVNPYLIPAVLDPVVEYGVSPVAKNMEASSGLMTSSEKALSPTDRIAIGKMDTPNLNPGDEKATGYEAAQVYEKLPILAFERIVSPHAPKCDVCHYCGRCTPGEVIHECYTCGQIYCHEDCHVDDILNEDCMQAKPCKHTLECTEAALVDAFIMSSGHSKSANTEANAKATWENAAADDPFATGNAAGKNINDPIANSGAALTLAELDLIDNPPTEQERQRFLSMLEDHKYTMLSPKNPIYTRTFKVADPCHSCKNATGEVLDCWGCSQAYCSPQCAIDDMYHCNSANPDACGHGQNCRAEAQLAVHTKIFRKEQRDEAARHGPAV